MNAFAQSYAQQDPEARTLDTTETCGSCGCPENSHWEREESHFDDVTGRTYSGTAAGCRKCNTCSGFVEA